MKTAKKLSLLLCALFVAAQPVLAQNGEDARNKAVMTTDDGERLLNTDEISIIRFDGPKVTVVQPWGATVFDRTLRSLTFMRPLPGMLRLTATSTINGDDAVTRGLDINAGGQLAASWKTGDQVYVYADATTTTPIGTLTPETTDVKTSKLTGDVTATGLTNGQTLFLSTKPRNHSFATQTNSLDDLFYYKAEATVTITGANASIADASFSMAQSVTCFTLQDGSGDAVNATQLVITGGTEDITVTSTATNVFYVAMPAKASTAYNFTATTSDSREWTGTKTAALVNGKYYRTTVTLTKTKLTVTDPSSTMTTAVEAKKNGTANQSYTGSALELVTAGVSSAGTLKYQATTTNSKPSKSEGTWSTSVPTATAAGTYYIWYYAEGNDNYNETAVSVTPVTVTIDKAAGTTDPASTMTTPVAAKKNGEANQSYTGSALELVTAGESSAGTLKYKVTTNSDAPTKDAEGWSTDVPTATAAGTYYVWYYAEGNDNYNETAVSATPVTVTIDKAAGTTDPASTMTTPVAAKKNGEANQTYTGSALELVTAGESSAGELKYQVTTTNTQPSKDEGTWTTTVPTATDAGTYYVWYYAEGNDNYNETVVSAEPITVTLDKIPFSHPDFVIADVTSQTYTGSAITPTPGVTLGGVAIAAGEKTFTYSYEANINAGTAKVILTPAADGNISGDPREVSFTIAPAAVTITAETTQSVTYNRNPQPLTASVSAGTLTITYYTDEERTVGGTTTAPTNAGTYYARVIQTNPNYDPDATDIVYTINKKTVTVSGITAANKTYDGTDVATLDCSNPIFDGIITGDILTITATGHFTEVNVGTDKDVAIEELTLGGTSVDNYQLAGEGNQNIAKANITAASITPVATMEGWTYGGDAQSPMVTGNTGSGLETPYYKSAESDWTTTQPTNAGTYQVKVLVAASGNYAAAETAPVEFTIAKAAPTYTAPAYSALTYTGSAQNLVSAGTSEHGTFTYSTTQDGTYTADIPQGTDANTYTVWWKFTGDANHSDVAATEVTGVSIANATMTGITATPYEAAYDGNAHGITVNNLPEGVTVTYSEDGQTYQADNYTYTDVAAARTVYYKVSKTNYSDFIGSSTVTITQATNSFTAQPTITGWTYGAEANIPTGGEAAFGTSTITYKYCDTENGEYGTYESVVNGNAGIWYVKGFVEATTNYAAATSNAVSFTIAKANASITSAPTAVSGWTADVSAHDLFNAGSGVTGGTLKYFSSTTNSTPATDASGWSPDIPQATDAGTYYLWYFVEGDANHNNVAVTSLGSVTVTTSDPGVALASSSAGDIVSSNGKAYPVSYANSWNNSWGTKAGVVVYKSGSTGYVVSLYNCGGSASSDGMNYIWDARANGLSSVTSVSGHSWIVGTKDQYTTALTNQWSTAMGYITSAGGRTLGEEDYWSDTVPYGYSQGGFFEGIVDQWEEEYSFCYVRPLFAF